MGLVDKRVAARYEVITESERLAQPGHGELERLRTWDILERVLPPSGRVLDVGGGPGVHAEWMAGRGLDVVLYDPLERHVAEAAARAAGAERRFTAALGEARQLPEADESADAVVLLGPLYHLIERSERVDALVEARRVLRPGGVVVAGSISRAAWVMDAIRRDRIGDPAIWADFEANLGQGLSADPDNAVLGGFWAYFHWPADLRGEVEAAGFDDVSLVAVEGFAWLLGDLEDQLAQRREELLRALRLVEAEPSLLGASSHVIAVGHRR